MVRHPFFSACPLAGSPSSIVPDLDALAHIQFIGCAVSDLEAEDLHGVFVQEAPFRLFLQP